jgi:hypothetical protein
MSIDHSGFMAWNNHDDFSDEPPSLELAIERDSFVNALDISRFESMLRQTVDLYSREYDVAYHYRWVVVPTLGESQQRIAARIEPTFGRVPSLT